MEQMSALNWVDLSVVKWVAGKVFLIFYCDKRIEKGCKEIRRANHYKSYISDFL